MQLNKFALRYFSVFNLVHFLEFRVNPWRLTRQWTDAHFCRFLTELEYSPISEKFPLTTAPCTLYTEQKQNGKIFKKFFILKVLMYQNNFDVTICFLILYKRHIEYIFCYFTLETLYRITLWQFEKTKKVENTTLNFF